MKHIRKHLKLIAAFFTVNMLSSLILPNVAYALTAGPTSPDYSSFEPVDTTDMVNLLSGDLAYNIPLLEVPGPAGGYPLSLSYHAGIMPNEEASWVGLGWTLNPGIINRSVNGYPDDHKDVESTDRFFWAGGTRTQVDVGVSLGIAGSAGLSAGLSIGTDTYQGVGVGAFVSAGIELGEKSGIGANSRMGVDPWGNGYQSFGLAIGREISGLNFSAGPSTNFQSVGFSGGVSASYSDRTDAEQKPRNRIRKGGPSLIGASLSTNSKGVSVSATVAGATGIVNNKSGNLSTSSFGFTLPIPFIHLGFQQTRYWIDETENIATNGALYYPDHNVSKAWLDENTYDTYYAVDADEFTSSGFPELNATKSLGGSFVNYDHYSVTGQGIAGNIQPYKFQQHLLRQNVTQGDEAIQYVTGYDSDQSFQWRFVNDFSNRYEYDPANFSSGYGQLNNSDFNYAPASAVGKSGINSLINGQAGSKSIITYTNKQITDGVTGFIDNNTTGFSRSSLPWDQIGAYIITNESGVSYHYTLPACTYDEYQYSENIEKGEGHTFNELKRPEEYSYAWHLTAITGPDFVDRAPFGELDEADWGYWVDFEYGKWTEQYYWRNPGQGKKMDIDNNFQNFSEGTKEIYYLDAIKTKTHVAVFMKEGRQDAKSSLKYLRNQKNHLNTGWETNSVTADNFDGSFDPKVLTANADVTYYDSQEGNNYGYTENLNYLAGPTQSLKLNKVCLLKKEDFESLNIQKTVGFWPHSSINQTSHDWPRSYNTDPNYSSAARTALNEMFDELEGISFNQHLPENVYDINDIDQAVLSAKSLRVIEFDNNHYDLVPNTPNSSSGKLTLKGVDFLGKGGIQVVPGMDFVYDLNEGFQAASINKVPTADLNGHFALNNITTAPNALQEGDVLEIFAEGQTRYYTVVWEMSSTKYGIEPIHNSLGGAGGTVSATYRLTKNPPYNKDYYDNWGMYKSDFDENLCQVNETLGRQVTNISSKGVDAWSLRKVRTGLGSTIDIDYESDVIDEIATLGTNLFTVEKVRDRGNSLFDIYLNENVDLKKYYSIDNNISFSGVFSFHPSQHDSYDVIGESNSLYKPTFLFPISGTNSYYGPKDYPVNVANCEIKIVGTNYIRIESDELSAKLNGTKVIQRYEVMTINGSLTSEKRKYTATFTEYPDYFFGGYVSSIQNESKMGGGTRVREVSVNSNGNSNSIRYSYESGVSSYMPYGLIPGQEGEDASILANPDMAVKRVENNSYSIYSSIFKNSREIPAPGVLYGKVEVQGFSNDIQIPNHEVYEFETFKSGMVDFHKDFDEDIPVTDNNWSYDLKQFKRQRARRIYKKDFTSRVGSLKSVTLYDNNNNKLNETVNHYLHDELNYPADPSDKEYFDENRLNYENLLNTKFNKQGVIDETFADARLIKNDDQYEMLGIISKKEKYPSVLTGTTTTNFKTGITTTTKNLAYDYYSGQLTESFSEDGYGNKYVSKSVPAYHFYDEMADKNMLIQEGTNYSYLMNSGFDPDSYFYNDNVIDNAAGLVGAYAQTWSKSIPVMNANSNIGNQSADKIYRKEASYSHIGLTSVSLLDDGTYPKTSFSELAENPISLAANASWKRNAEISLYDVNSHALEALDVNGNYAATKFDSKNLRVFATVANARYNDFAYSGAEDETEIIGGLYYFGGGVRRAGGIVGDESDGYKIHTGEKSIKTTSYQNVFIYEIDNPDPGSIYRASVWSTHPNAILEYKLDGGSYITAATGSGSKKAGEWYLLQADINVGTASTLKVNTRSQNGNTMYWDDFRVHPINAVMTSYAYNEWGELSDILDANNLFTHYEYDAAGRLKEISRETFSDGPTKISDMNIHYATTSNTSFYGNVTNTQNGNTLILSVDFVPPGSGDYQYQWNINGAISNTTNDTHNFIVNATNKGWKDVIATVTDQQTGLDFSSYKRVYANYCHPSGTFMFSSCELDTDGCTTGWLINYYHNGSCGSYQGASTYDLTQCPSNQLPIEGDCSPIENNN
ncbi:MAG: RHS repeat domain-containing protein [Cyclobacteriaceae bacterium]